jgi:hypothetical protein
MEDTLIGVVTIREASGYPCVRFGGEKMAPVLLSERDKAMQLVGKEVLFSIDPCAYLYFTTDYGYAKILKVL